MVADMVEPIFDMVHDAATQPYMLGYSKIWLLILPLYRVTKEWIDGETMMYYVLYNYFSAKCYITAL